jgi:putative copper resistance protein D
VPAAGLAGLLALVGVLGAAPAGHMATLADQQTALAGRALHLIGMSAWAGGLLALVLLWPGLWQERVAASAAHGYSSIAGWSYLVVSASGVMSGYAVLGSFAALGSAYGLLLVLKAGLLLALGGLGWWHRRHSLTQLDRAGAHAFLRLATGEVALMAVAIGLAVALANTAPPMP